MQDTILVLSRNPGLSGLTARTLRCRQVYCTPLPFATSAQEASALMPRGIVLAAMMRTATRLRILIFPY